MADAFKSNWRRVKGEGFMRRMLSPSDLEHYQKGAYTVCLEEFEFRSPTTVAASSQLVYPALATREQTVATGFAAAEKPLSDIWSSRPGLDYTETH